MSKSSTPALVFDGVSLTKHQRNNQLYFSASDIAKALKYSREDAISNIYKRNADEFTPDMSETVNLTVSGNLQKSVRLFSLREAHLVAMFSRTKAAKDFRKWVLDVLEKETKQNNRLCPVRYLSAEEQSAINPRKGIDGLSERPFLPTTMTDAEIADKQAKINRWPLTSHAASRYAVHALKNGVGISLLDCLRRTLPSERFFHVRSLSLFMSGACGASSDAPVTLDAGRLTRKLLLTRLASGTQASKLV